MSRSLACVLALVCAPASAGELELTPSLTMLGEYDSNARRQAIDEDLDADKTPVSDGLIRARAGLQLRARGAQGQLVIDGNVGLKRFWRERGQSMGVAQVQAAYARALPWRMILSATHFQRMRGQLSGVRTWALTRNDVGVSRALPSRSLDKDITTKGGLLETTLREVMGARLCRPC